MVAGVPLLFLAAVTVIGLYSVLIESKHTGCVAAGTPCTDLPVPPEYKAVERQRRIERRCAQLAGTRTSDKTPNDLAELRACGY